MIGHRNGLGFVTWSIDFSISLSALLFGAMEMNRMLVKQLIIIRWVKTYIASMIFDLVGGL